MKYLQFWPSFNIGDKYIMKLQIKETVIFSLSVFVFCSTLQAQEIDSESSPNVEEEAEVNEIVVKAFKNFCIPQVMREKLGSSSEFLANFVSPPGFKFPEQTTSGNPNFFQAAPNTMSVTSIDNEAKKFKIRIGYMACEPKNCPTILEKNSDLVFEKKLDMSSDILWHFAIIQDVKFEQLYNAHHEDVKVSCPPGTCNGVVIESNFGRMFYTAIRSGGDVVRRLVVHGGIGSKMTAADDDQGDIDKCETSEEPLTTKKKKK